jgi:hypothetical protein
LPQILAARNLLRIRSFPKEMKAEHQFEPGEEVDGMDRRLIRVDVQPSHAGIMTALRRAFEAAASEPTDRDFADLLRRLN